MKGILKKMAIVAGCFAFSAAMMAQTKALYLSSVEGTNVAQYDGQTRNVTLYRSVYNGWNTLCVPFNMTTEELNSAFGASCKLETLAAMTRNGDVIAYECSGILPKEITTDGIHLRKEAYHKWYNSLEELQHDKSFI